MPDFLNERNRHSGLIYLLILECFSILNMSMKNSILFLCPEENIGYYESKRKKNLRHNIEIEQNTIRYCFVCVLGQMEELIQNDFRSFWERDG